MCCDLWASYHILQNSLGAQTISQNRKGKIRQSKTKGKENDPPGPDGPARSQAGPPGPSGRPSRLPRSLPPLPCSPDQGRNRGASPPDPPRRRRGGDKIASAPASTDPSPRRLGLLPTYLHQLPSPSRPLSLSLPHPLARARSPPKPRRRRGPDHRSSSRRVPELPLRRPRRPRASGRAGVPCSGRVKLFPNLGRRRPPRFIPPPLCAPVHSRASVCRAVSLRPLLLPLVPPHAP